MNNKFVAIFLVWAITIPGIIFSTSVEGYKASENKSIAQALLPKILGT